MENFIGWIIVAFIVVSPMFAIYIGVRQYRKYRTEKAEYEKKQQEAIFQKNKEQAETWKSLKSGATHVGRTTYDYNLGTNRTTVTDRTTKRNISYVHENDSGPDLLTTMIVADMLLNNKNSSSGTVSWKDDIPSIVETDDSNRRKSSFSSFSDSTGGWGSSDSSSDSGPSSDW